MRTLDLSAEPMFEARLAKTIRTEGDSYAVVDLAQRVLILA